MAMIPEQLHLQQRCRTILHASSQPFGLIADPVSRVGFFWGFSIGSRFHRALPNQQMV